MTTLTLTAPERPAAVMRGSLGKDDCEGEAAGRWDDHTLEARLIREFEKRRKGNVVRWRVRDMRRVLKVSSKALRLALAHIEGMDWADYYRLPAVERPSRSGKRRWDTTYRIHVPDPPKPPKPGRLYNLPVKKIETAAHIRHGTLASRLRKLGWEVFPTLTRGPKNWVHGYRVRKSDDLAGPSYIDLNKVRVTTPVQVVEDQSRACLVCGDDLAGGAVRALRSDKTVCSDACAGKLHRHPERYGHPGLGVVRPTPRKMERSDPKQERVTAQAPPSLGKLSGSEVEVEAVRSEAPVLPRQSPSPATPPMNYNDRRTVYLIVDGIKAQRLNDGTYTHIGSTPSGWKYGFYSTPLAYDSFVKVTGRLSHRSTRDEPIVFLADTDVVQLKNVTRAYDDRILPGWIPFMELPEDHPWHDDDYMDFEAINAGRLEREGRANPEQQDKWMEQGRKNFEAFQAMRGEDLPVVAQSVPTAERKAQAAGETLAAAIKVVPLDVSREKHNEYAIKTIAKFIANQYSQADAEAEVMPYSDWCEIEERNAMLIAKAATERQGA